MPAHDLPYFEPAGGQNPEASSVVKAFGLARSRETASPAACRHGQGTAGGSSRATRGAARCLAAGPGAARVRRWWQVARLPRARATGRGHGPGGRRLRCHRHGRAGPPPPAPAARCAGPAAARSRSGGNGPSGLGPVRLGLMSDRAVTGAGLSGARFPRLPRGPGSDRAAPGAPGAAGMAGREWRAGRSVPRCGQPLVPTGPQRPVRIFSNHTVLAGAPLRNRAVDLLLTIESYQHTDLASKT